MKTKNKFKKKEFGDFQTPYELTNKISQLLKNIDINPQSIIEPTCGKGNFILSAINTFDNLQSCIVVEINSAHIQELSNNLTHNKKSSLVNLINDSFFCVNWNQILKEIPKPFLILGNPPWVTNSELGNLHSNNLPKKSNFQGYRGLDALTGKSNFDISESMILQHLQWLNKYPGTIAMLCKTSVARKILTYAWKNNYYIDDSKIYQIDTAKYFNASVNACLLIIRSSRSKSKKQCWYYHNLDTNEQSKVFSYQDSQLIANTTLYQKTKNLQGQDSFYTWRSGVKHDRAKVMELVKEGNVYINGYQQKLHLEDTLIYPLLKSSDISKGNTKACRKYILLTQRYIGQDTQYIKNTAPQTWNYLQENKHLFDKRASLIYRNRPQFSIFGVGEYTFAPWKVAISGLSKKLNFEAIGYINNKPVILDDTVYFLSCKTREEAIFLSEILKSSIVCDFFESMIFWDNKRPITIELLKKLNLRKLSQAMNREHQYNLYANLHKTNY